MAPRQKAEGITPAVLPQALTPLRKCVRKHFASSCKASHKYQSVQEGDQSLKSQASVWLLVFQMAASFTPNT